MQRIILAYIVRLAVIELRVYTKLKYRKAITQYDITSQTGYVRECSYILYQIINHLNTMKNKLLKLTISKSDYCPTCGRIWYNCVCSHDDLDDE